MRIIIDVKEDAVVSLQKIYGEITDVLRHPKEVIAASEGRLIDDENGKTIVSIEIYREKPVAV